MKTRAIAAAAACAFLISLPARAAPATVQAPLSTTKEKILVVGGKQVPSGRYPWQVALVSAESGDFVAGIFCGGTLIDSKWVLTAAHCFFDPQTCAEYDKKRYYVAYGSTDLGASLSLKGAASVYIRDGYKCGTNPNDIALILLKQPINGVPTVHLASAADRSQHTAPGGKLTTSGWGLTKVDGWVSRYLLEVEVPVVQEGTCKARYGSKLPSAVICAGEEGKDSCRGDSGGPLFANRGASTSVQLGIVSFGDGCGKAEAPGVYTDVVAHRDWIAKTIKDFTPPACTPADIAAGRC